MAEKIDIVYIPDGCSKHCSVMRASQMASLTVTANAQALFQGFLSCLEKTDLSHHWGPNTKKGQMMLAHFTQKLDETSVFNDICKDYCDNKGHCGQANDESEVKIQALEDKVESLNIALFNKNVLCQSAQNFNNELQLECDALEKSVEALSSKLANRRTQFDNRILISIFEIYFDCFADSFNQKSFFDIVPRDHLKDFLPFLRMVVMGPTLSQQFNEHAELILGDYRDNFGNISLGVFNDVMDDKRTQALVHKTASIFYTRAQHRDSFRLLMARKSTVSQRNVPLLIQLFESMKPNEVVYSKAG
jgi:hypothetical protein